MRAMDAGLRPAVRRLQPGVPPRLDRLRWRRRRVLSRKTLLMVIYLALVGLTVGLFKSVPSGFVPAQDKQYLIGFAQLPDGATLDRADAVMRRMSRHRAGPAGVANAVGFPGLSINGFTNSSSAGIVFATLKDFDQRSRPGAVGRGDRRRAEPQFAQIQEAFIAIFPPPPIEGIGQTGGFKLQLLDRGGVGYAGLDAATEGVHGQGPAGAGTAGAVLELPDQRPAALRRHRPGAGPPAERADHRGVRRDAGLPRQPLRQRLQPLRADLQRPRPGRCPVTGHGPRTSDC